MQQVNPGVKKVINFDESKLDSRKGKRNHSPTQTKELANSPSKSTTLAMDPNSTFFKK